jgi:hypothetical protein
VRACSKKNFCTEIITGQGATTIVVAHTMAVRNGRKIQMEEPINATMNSTASTTRVMSRWISAMLNFLHGPSNQSVNF